MANLTRWFPGHVRPARPGVYETQDSGLGDGHHYNLWDGKRWYYGYYDLAQQRGEWNQDEWPENAKSLKCWRGLAHPPK